MKRFMYFETAEGGMETHGFYDTNSIPKVYGWMEEDCIDDDKGLVSFVESAEVGDIYSHRLGECVRLKDA